MRYPKFIESGAAIGFAAPSFGAASEPYRTAFSCAHSREPMLFPQSFMAIV